MSLKNKFEISRILTIIFPFICSFLVVANSICRCYDINLSIFSYVGGTSIIVWIYFLCNSYMYSMCLHHKMFIYYLIFSNMIGLIDTYIGIPVSDFNYMLIYVISFGISIMFYGILKFRDNRKLKNEL